MKKSSYPIAGPMTTDTNKETLGVEHMGPQDLPVGRTFGCVGPVWRLMTTRSGQLLLMVCIPGGDLPDNGVLVGIPSPACFHGPGYHAQCECSVKLQSMNWGVRAN